MTALPKTTACICSINDEWLNISFNQPEKLNALTEELTTDIKNILDLFKDDHTVRGVTMTGE